MFLQLKLNRNGSYRARINDVLFMLEAHRNQPAPDHGPMLEADVMIVKALYSKSEDTGHFDYSVDPYGYIVRPITDDDMMIRHPGFECAGSMCQTTSHIKVNGSFRTLTPGRLHGGGFYVAENNGADFYKSPRMPLIGGLIFVKRSSVESGNGVIRAEGVPQYEDTLAHIKTTPAYLAWVAAQAEWQAEADARRARNAAEREQRVEAKHE